MAQNLTLQKIDEYRWRIPKSYMKGMRVDGIVYANEKLLENAKNDEALQQVANVAHLPGIVKHSLAMPDLHWGYGFVIGGVAATDPQRMAWFLPAASDTTSIAESASSGRTLMSHSLMESGRSSSVNCLRMSRVVSAQAAKFGSLSKRSGGC